MSRKAKLTDDMKLEILERRVHGESGRSIADDLPVTYAIVYSFLASLPGVPDETHVLRPRLTDVEFTQIFSLYLSGYNLDGVAKIMKIPEETLTQVFCFIKQRKRCTTSYYPLYPKVAQWMSDNGISATLLATMLDVPKSEMLGVLSGHYYHMTLEMANKIKAISGLQLQDIFSNAMTLKEKAITTANGERIAKNRARKRTADVTVGGVTGE